MGREGLKLGANRKKGKTSASQSGSKEGGSWILQEHTHWDTMHIITHLCNSCHYVTLHERFVIAASQINIAIIIFHKLFITKGCG